MSGVYIRFEFWSYHKCVFVLSLAKIGPKTAIEERKHLYGIFELLKPKLLSAAHWHRTSRSKIAVLLCLWQFINEPWLRSRHRRVLAIAFSDVRLGDVAGLVGWILECTCVVRSVSKAHSSSDRSIRFLAKSHIKDAISLTSLVVKARTFPKSNFKSW